MRTIKRSDILNEYGIDLPVGKFKVSAVGNEYVIQSVQDDTQGCPLLGAIKTTNGVKDCREVNAKLIKLIQGVEAAGDEVWVVVR